MIKLLRKLHRQEALYALVCAVMVVLQVWLELTMPDYTSQLTQEVSVAMAMSGEVAMSAIVKNGALMILCALGSVAGSIVCGFFAARLAASFARTLRSELFGKVSGFSDANYNSFGVPSLITRTTNDVVQLQNFVAMGLQMLIKAPIMAIWAITKISFVSIYWTSAALIAVVFIMSAAGILVMLCLPRFRKIQTLTDNLNDATRENLSGVRVVRAFNAEKYQESRFEKVNEEITSNHLFTSRSMGLLLPVMTLGMNALMLAIYWIGAYLINEAELTEKAVTMGNMIAFTQYAMQIVMSFMMLIMIFILLPRAMVSAKRLNDVLETDITMTYSDKSVEKKEKGKIEFKNVSFGYNDADKPCVSGLNFTVNPGETFAIIGATGTGKSSIVNLIPRYYDITGGELLIDGVDIKKYPKEQLQSIVSIAPQKAILFAGSVKSNISYGSESDDERIQRALDIAQAGFVNELEKGVDSEVAQGATNFSGGQKQRMSIARAVYRDSEIYIFDDTFSALDYKTDMLVRKSLKEQLGDKTIIIVAQRIGTIKNADKILVLDEGKIAGIGTHEELIKTCPIYNEIALSQLSKEEL
ncbi:MAG: ABC transporter ATP-binding protein/permease [Lachnospiraceae bacterium]|nr:ABC transporter ATP-binding protein/permease [Lachnospiraceae bacterium]